ncbi:hypothetical protein F2Q69_00030111 [Brassica cretica]|uniref:Uncharacterized protein n=1 Tax=Brassica cretica TaxID=69181 RepID=A0A8S9S6U4_BRACR|nr:hypothetical protein F2Q69_00030111 [Brassica cretica]
MFDIDRHQDPVADRQPNSNDDRHNSSTVDRQPPLTYRVQLPKIDEVRLNALRNPSQPSDHLADNFEQLSDDTPEPMQVDTERRTLRKKKEKVPKHLKRGVNEKEMDSFTKRVLRIPLDKPFGEAYFNHRLWMFFRETKETEQDIHRIFDQIREKMKQRITLKKKTCHCNYEDEYETEYSRSIDSGTPPSIDIAIHPSIDDKSRE